MVENKGAEWYNDNLCEAINIIVKAGINELAFDKTIVCTVTDDSEKTFGKYTVTDGSTTFNAYSENDSYVVDAKVLVLIPNGDWTQQKRITGKYISSDDAPFIYHSPLDGIHNISGNLVESLNEYGVSASGRENEVVELVNRTNLNFQRSEMPRLCIKADFKTLLNDYRFTSGSYGIRACFNNEYYIDFSSKTDMFGSVYNFADWVSQEQVYEIPKEIDTIASLVVWLYQDGNFKYIDENGEEALLEPIKQSETENFKNILIKNTKVFLGTEDTVSTGAYIHTNQSLTYSPGDVKRSIHLRWNLIDSNKEPILIGEGATVQWFVDDEVLKQSGESIEINCKEKQTFTQVKARVTLANNTGVFDSNILRFDNQLDKDSKVPLADIKLEIVNDENALDAYPYYNYDNNIINEDEGEEKTRTVKLVWSSSKGNIDDSYWKGAKIQWSTPQENTMIKAKDNWLEEVDLYIEEDEENYYLNNEFEYTISNTFSDSYKDNTIICTITLAKDKDYGNKQTQLIATKSITFSQHPVNEDGEEISPEENMEVMKTYIVDEVIGDPDGSTPGSVYHRIKNPYGYVSQEQEFKVLTDDGKLKGLFMQEGKLYINASYMTTGILRSENWDGTLYNKTLNKYYTVEQAELAVENKEASWDDIWTLDANEGTYWNLNNGQIFAKNFELNAWDNTTSSGLSLNSNPDINQYYLSVGNSKNFIQFRQDGKIVIDAFEDSRGVYLNSKLEEDDEYWFIIGEGNKEDGGKNNFIQMDKEGNFTIQTNGKFILNAWKFVEDSDEEDTYQGVYINSDADDNLNRYFQIGNSKNYIMYTTNGLEMKIPSTQIYLSDTDNENLQGYIETTAGKISASVTDNKLDKSGNNGSSFGWSLTSAGFYIDKSTNPNSKNYIMKVDAEGLSVKGNIEADSGTIGTWTVGTPAWLQDGETNEFTRALYSQIQADDGYDYITCLRTPDKSAAHLTYLVKRIDRSLNHVHDNFQDIFYIRANGAILATRGTIGGITINNSSLSAGKFEITSAGKLTCKSGSIGGININDGNLSTSNGTFSITSEGYLTCKSGSIGEWKIQSFDSTNDPWESVSGGAVIRFQGSCLSYEGSKLVGGDGTINNRYDYQTHIYLAPVGLYVKGYYKWQDDEDEEYTANYYRFTSWARMAV